MQFVCGYLGVIGQFEFFGGMFVKGEFFVWIIWVDKLNCVVELIEFFFVKGGFGFFWIVIIVWCDIDVFDLEFKFFVGWNQFECVVRQWQVDQVYGVIWLMDIV